MLNYSEDSFKNNFHQGPWYRENPGSSLGNHVLSIFRGS